MSEDKENVNSKPVLPKLWILVSLGAVGPLAMNIFIPSIPGLMLIFDSGYGQVQLVLTAYLISMALAQLVVGPLSDRFGRRLVVLCGLVTCIVGSGLCICASQIEVLVLGRVVQAIGASSGLVMSRTIIRDVFGIDRASSVMGYLTMAMVIVPMLSPIIGGVLDDAFGWEASFVLVFIYVLIICLACLRCLQETRREPSDKEKTNTIISDFWWLLRQWKFNRYAFQISFSSAAFYTFLGGSPFVAIELFGATKSEYGLYYMMAAGAYMLGNYFTGRYSIWLGSQKIIFLGTFTSLIGGLFLSYVYFTNILSTGSLFLGMSIIALGNGLSLPAGNAAAISADTKRIGTAAGLSGFMQIGFGAAGAYIAGLLLSNSAAPFIVIMFGSVLLAFVINIIGERISVSR